MDTSKIKRNHRMINKFNKKTNYKCIQTKKSIQTDSTKKLITKTFKKKLIDVYLQKSE